MVANFNADKFLQHGPTIDNPGLKYIDRSGYVSAVEFQNGKLQETRVVVDNKIIPPYMVTTTNYEPSISEALFNRLPRHLQRDPWFAPTMLFSNRRGQFQTPFVRESRTLGKGLQIYADDKLTAILYGPFIYIYTTQTPYLGAFYQPFLILYAGSREAKAFYNADPKTHAEAMFLGSAFIVSALTLTTILGLDLTGKLTVCHVDLSFMGGTFEKAPITITLFPPAESYSANNVIYINTYSRHWGHKSVTPDTCRDAESENPKYKELYPYAKRETVQDNGFWIAP